MQSHDNTRDGDRESTDSPERLSDWLRDQDVIELGTLARGARLAGRSFGERLIDTE